MADGSIVVWGQEVDAETRCIHWRTALDVVAIELACCRRFYPCRDCHDEDVDHVTATWSRAEFDHEAVLCGVCRGLLTIEAYLGGDDACPHCSAAFNPGCRAHRHLYFE